MHAMKFCAGQTTGCPVVAFPVASGRDIYYVKVTLPFNKDKLLHGTGAVKWGLSDLSRLAWPGAPSFQ